jgi:hypothetical protein
MRWPDEPTTPEQWQVIAWGAVMLFVVVGSIGIWYSFSAPAAKVDLARQIRWYSLSLWALAAVIYGVKRAIEYFVR